MIWDDEKRLSFLFSHFFSVQKFLSYVVERAIRNGMNFKLRGFSVQFQYNEFSFVLVIKTDLYQHHLQ